VLVDDCIDDPVDEAESALAHNDTLPFLSNRDALLETVPTGTNVSDLRVFVLE
jgi:hydroxypyruvate reductase